MLGEDAGGLVERLRRCRWVDLTHTLEDGIPAVPTHARFGHVLYGSHALGHHACHYQLVMGEHSGTHIDAPLHFIAEGPTSYGVDAILPERTVGRAATIGVPDLSPGETLGAERIQEWEEEFGPIEPGDVVLFGFGWDKLWRTGAEARGFLEGWPGLSEEAAQYLVDKRVSLVGTDAVSIDVSGFPEHPAHHVLLGNEVYIVENLKNLGNLPPFCVFLAMPLKVEGGSGSPLRAVALVPD